MATQGFGCMGFSAFYSSANTTTEEKATDIVHRAFDLGVTLFNTATFYGPLNIEGFGHNLRLINKCIAGLDRSKIQLMVKVGMDTKADMDKTGQRWVMSGKLESLRVDVDYALQELGVDYIDIIVLCRVPTDVTIEEAVSNMKLLVDEGKAKYIGLSEASASTIRRAAAISPIYCIEQEWSIWCRDAELDVFPTCRELGIKIVAYSPLGRGFLTGTIQNRDELSDFDYRKRMEPRFNDDNFNHNYQIVDAIKQIAEKKQCTVGQLSLAWLHAQGSDVIPIPGTCNLTHLDENLTARNIYLSSEELSEIDGICKKYSIVGNRYLHMERTYQYN